MRFRAYKHHRVSSKLFSMLSTFLTIILTSEDIMRSTLNFPVRIGHDAKWKRKKECLNRTVDADCLERLCMIIARFSLALQGTLRSRK